MSRITTRLTIIVLIVLGPAVLEAQEASTISLNDLHRMVLDQQQTIESQAEQISNQQTLIQDQIKALKDLSTKLDQVAQSQAAATGANIEPPSEDEIALRERLAALEKSASAEPEMPANVLTAGDFKGSIRIPGTNMAGKVGGNVRLGVVSSFDPIGSDDRFIAGSIPVPQDDVDPEVTASSGTTISAKRSRMNLDMRLDSSVGQFRAFLEGDFTTAVGSSDVYRLRHAFGQYNRFILGQTWSTFMDLQAQPEDVDFEGLNSMLLERHPILRWTKGLGNQRIFAVAIEDPTPQIANGEGNSDAPDLVSTIRLQRDAWHLQLGGVARTLSGEQSVDSGDEAVESVSGPTDSTLGWGLSGSGSQKVSFWGDRDLFMWQLNLGEGIGRYVNDLSSVGGQDAVFDPDGALKALPTLAGYVSFRHYWKRDPMALFGSNRTLLRDVRSTLTYGFVTIDNFDFQPEDAYKSTQRASVNVIWSPIAPIDLGVEYLWGRRKNKSGNSSSASQFQIVATFKF